MFGVPFLTFFLWSILFFPAQAQTEKTYSLPEEWRIGQQLHLVQQEVEQISGAIGRLEQVNQKFHELLTCLQQEPDSLQASFVRKKQSDQVSTFLKEVEHLNQTYQTLLQKQQPVQSLLDNLEKQLLQELEQNQTQIRTLQKETLELEKKQILFLEDYKQNKNPQFRQQLRRLFDLTQKNLQTKELLLKKEQEQQHQLVQTHKHFSEVQQLFTHLKNSLQEILLLLQEEKQFLLEWARSQIGLLQTQNLVGRIRKKQEELCLLEQNLSRQIHQYTNTQEQLEEHLFQIGHDFPPVSNPPLLFPEK